MEELYAKVQKPRDRKKQSKEVVKEGKELMMNGGNHTMEDSSPPPIPASGMWVTITAKCSYAVPFVLSFSLTFTCV